MVEDFTKRTTFYHRLSDRYYQLSERDGRYFQRRHQIGFDGRETNVVEKEIHFVVGSGNHARTYLHRTADGKIFELPVAWYAQNGGYWAMNPGYDHPNHSDSAARSCRNACSVIPRTPRSRPGVTGLVATPGFRDACRRASTASAATDPADVTWRPFRLGTRKPFAKQL